MQQKAKANGAGERKMSKEQLTNLANNLFEQAVEANSFWCILQQYRKNIKTHHDEMLCSVAFYNIVYRALVTSLLLLLSRMYDKNTKALTISSLLNGMSEMTEDDIEEKTREAYDFCGGKFQHQLKPTEECFYEKTVREKKQILETLGYEYHGTTVDLSLQECVRLYHNRYRALRKAKSINNLAAQRNRIIAHNDSETNFSFDEVFEAFPLSFDDVEVLLNFAIDCTQFVRGVISGVYTIPEYVNIDDWSITLNLVHHSLEKTAKPIVLLGEDYAAMNLQEDKE